MNNEADCRTAPATPGLLKKGTISDGAISSSFGTVHISLPPVGSLQNRYRYVAEINRDLASFITGKKGTNIYFFFI